MPLTELVEKEFKTTRIFRGRLALQERIDGNVDPNATTPTSGSSILEIIPAEVMEGVTLKDPGPDPDPAVVVVVADDEIQDDQAKKSYRRKSRFHEKIEDYLLAQKYLKQTTPWEKTEVQEWGLEIGAEVILHSFTGHIRPPYSVLPAVIKRQNLHEDYKKLRAAITEMYEHVREEGLDAAADVIMAKNSYAVAWIPEKDKFYRVRIKERADAEHAVVNCFDDGFSAIVDVEHCYPICSKFLILRPRVVNLTLDGLERFDYCKVVKKIMSSFDWRAPRLRFKVTRHVKVAKLTSVYGLIFQEGESVDGNSAVLRKLWRNAKLPKLPRADNGRIGGAVVHAEDDGTVFVTLDSPVNSAYRDYCSQTKKSLAEILTNYESLMEKQANKSCLSSREVYLLVDEDTREFSRVKYIPTKKKLLKKSSKEAPQKAVVEKGKPMDSSLMDESIRFKFIDIGKEENCLASSIVLVAKKVHPYLALVPPVCIKGHLVNVKTLNSKRFMQEIVSKGPFIVRTVKKPRACECLAEIQLFMSQSHPGGLRTFVSVADYGDVVQMLTKYDAGELIPEFPPENKLKRLEPTQLENIRMQGSANWSEIPGRTPDQIMEHGATIYFFIKKISAPHEFVIHPAGTDKLMAEMSSDIENYIKLPWIFKTMTSEKTVAHPKWFYTYFFEEKKLFTRVRYIEEGLEDTVKVLLIDFAEYVQIPAKELFLTIPFQVCRSGPLAVRVDGYKHPKPFSLNYSKNFAQFKKVFEGQKCSATVKHMYYDENGRLSIRIEDLEVEFAGI